MFKLRTHDNYGNKLYAPENAPIINIQCNDPIIDLLNNYVDPEDESYTLSDLISLIKSDIDCDNKQFLIDDLNRLFAAIGA